jgi:transposase
MAETTRREFADEFKREAVALRETSGRLQIDVASELGIQPSLLRRWQKQALDLPTMTPAVLRPAIRPATSSMTSAADQVAEIARLKRELERTRMERDILQKAVGICAEVPR